MSSDGCLNYMTKVKQAMKTNVATPEMSVAKFIFGLCFVYSTIMSQSNEKNHH